LRPDRADHRAHAPPAPCAINPATSAIQVSIVSSCNVRIGRADPVKTFEERRKRPGDEFASMPNEVTVGRRVVQVDKLLQPPEVDCGEPLHLISERLTIARHDRINITSRCGGLSCCTNSAYSFRID